MVNGQRLCCVCTTICTNQGRSRKAGGARTFQSAATPERQRDLANSQPSFHPTLLRTGKSTGKSALRWAKQIRTPPADRAIQGSLLNLAGLRGNSKVRPKF